MERDVLISHTGLLGNACQAGTYGGSVSSGLTCISKQTGMERDVLISHSDKRGRMGRERTDLLRGTLDLLILKALALEPLHGVGVSRRITQITRSGGLTCHAEDP